MAAPAGVSWPPQRWTADQPQASARVVSMDANCLFGQSRAGTCSRTLSQGGLRRTGCVFTARPCPASKPSADFSPSPPSPGVAGRTPGFRHEKWGPRRGGGDFRPGSHAEIGRSKTVASLNAWGVPPCVEQVARRGPGECSPHRSYSPVSLSGVAPDAAGQRSPSIDRFEARRAGNFDCVDFVCRMGVGEFSPRRSDAGTSPVRADQLLRHRQEGADIESACRLGTGQCSPRRDGNPRPPALGAIASPRERPTGLLNEIGTRSASPREAKRMPSGSTLPEHRTARRPVSPRRPVSRLASCQIPKRWAIPSPKAVIAAAESSMDTKWERMSSTSRMQSAHVRPVPTAIAEYSWRKDHGDDDADTVTPTSSRRCSVTESANSGSPPESPESGEDGEAATNGKSSLRQRETEAVFKVFGMVQQTPE